MKTIWKFKLNTLAEDQTFAMPKGAEILAVQVQRGTPCLWALVDPDEKKEKRHIEIFGTGQQIYCDKGIMGISRKYIGTFQLNKGALVFHVFEYIGV